MFYKFAIVFRYEEVCTKDFEFGKDPIPHGTAHFTQIVWNSTKQLGIGRAIIRHIDRTCTYFVARYEPAGNWLGKFKQEVRKGDFTKDVCKNLTSIIKDASGEQCESSSSIESDRPKENPVNDEDDSDNSKKKPSQKPAQAQEPKNPTTAPLKASQQGLLNSLESSECHMGTIEGIHPLM